MIDTGYERFDHTVYDMVYVSPEAMGIVPDDEAYVLSDKEAGKRRWLKFKKYIPIVIMWGVWIFFTFHIVFQGFCMVMGIYELDISWLNYNIAACILYSVGPAIMWLYCSTVEYFTTYMNRKMFTLTITVFSFCMMIAQMFYAASYHLLMPLVFKLPVTRDITPSMIVNLGRGVQAVVVILPLIFVSRSLLKRVLAKENKEYIQAFKFNRNIDTRKNKKYCYDASFVKRIDNGKVHVIKEQDRFLHTLYDGTTGTAKTAGCINTGIVCDLNKKASNEDALKKLLLKLLRKGHIRLIKDFEDVEFSADNFEPITDKGKKLLTKYTSMIKTAGITLLAPNSSLVDDAYAYSIKRGFKINRIDPTLDAFGRHKPGFIGFNPLYIDPNLRGLDRRIEINAKACLFADVLQAVYDSGSKGDPYFASVNRNMTTVTTILLELTFEGFYHRQPDPSDVQDVINDFERSRKFLEALKDMPDCKDYQFIIDYVDFNMLGAGRKDMDKQANGLRMLLNDLLINPLFKNVLCSRESIDIDKALKNGEITVVNYATELGVSQAMAFGMFFAFNFNNAVMRRPGTAQTRVPNFYYIDEFPVLLHPKFEQCFTYFRQFRVATHVAIQSIGQMRKNPSTAYFESVLLGNTGHQIFFGRMSHVEMDIIEKLGGMKDDVMEQNTISETALSLENTSMSMSSRTTAQKVSRIDGSMARYSDFMHIYLFTVDQGNAVPPFQGKVDFVEKYEKLGIKRFRVKWSRYFSGHTKPAEEEYTEDEQTESVPYAVRTGVIDVSTSGKSIDRTDKELNNILDEKDKIDDNDVMTFSFEEDDDE